VDYTKLDATLTKATTRSELQQVIVNAPFEQKLETAMMFLGIIVLLVVNQETGTIDRVALSNTELAQNTTTVSVKEFSDIKIPVGHADNIIAQAIATGQPRETTDWENLFVPELSAEEARLNQASGGIAFSAVYPLPGICNGAAMIFSYYQYAHEIGDEQHVFMKRYSQMAADALSAVAPASPA
jgi:hypothetical protein